jgi:hypothetical protein
MKTEKPIAPRKTYDAIEDAINQSKHPARPTDQKDHPTSKRIVDKGEQDGPSQKNRAAARVY